MFAFPRLLVGLLFVSLSSAAFAQRVGEPTKPSGDSVPEPRYTVEGRVLDQLRRPIAGALVEFSPSSRVGVEPRRVRTTSDGEYFLGGVRLSEFTRRGQLKITAKDFVPAIAYVVPDTSVDGRILVPPVSLLIGTTVRGVVVDPAGEPIRGARLRIGSSGEFGNLAEALLWTTESDFEGRFAISDVPYGQRWCAVLAPGYRGSVERVDVVEGLEHRVVLEPTERRVSLKIEAEGRPWRFAPDPIRVVSWSPNERVWMPSTAPLSFDEEGRSLLPDLGLGRNWSAWMVGGPVSFTTGIREAGPAGIEEMSFLWPEKELKTFSWQLAGPRGHWPRGFWFFSEDGTSSYWRTDEIGKFDIPTRASISHRLIAERSTTRPVFAIDELQTVAQTSLDLWRPWDRGFTLTCRPVVPATGRVVDRAGEPVVGLELDLWVLSSASDGGGSRWQQLARVESRADGAFEVPEVEVGSTIYVSTSVAADWFGAARFPIALKNNVAELAVQRAAVIEGVVTNEEGEPVVGLLVQQNVQGDPANQQSQRAQTDREGRYRITGVAPGRHGLSVGSPPLKHFEFELVPGQTKRVDVQY